MGIGFTADTAVKVSHLGINSVLSLVDDMLLEKLRKFYSEKFSIQYSEISEKIDDFRAKRITSYLNLINKIVKDKFEDFKKNLATKSNELINFLELLPNNSEIIEKLTVTLRSKVKIDDIIKEIDKILSPGDIDVNIMTKIDKENYRDNEKLPIEYNDAHAAIRGFAKSDLNSSVVLSAGINPRLYSYMENFDEFFPDSDGNISKKIILKVSDYSSALTQGKFLAKKGIWVSEYRIESGLNCGGHAFATPGLLMGPILQVFKENREELQTSLFEILIESLAAKNRTVPNKILPIRVTAQGGVGTAQEHNMLLEHYELDSVGWGTPFLLVPEVSNVDEKTLNMLIEAKENDLYLSEVSPLGVLFNNLRGNTKDLRKIDYVNQGRPGSYCPKKYLVSDSEFTDKKICTASRVYQKNKINSLESLNLNRKEYADKFDEIVNKSCICVGLGTSALLVNDLDTQTEGPEVSVCPGPNLAYFSKKMTLKEMVGHIYGKFDFARADRPHMFMKELGMYIDYLSNIIKKKLKETSKNEIKYYNKYVENMNEGIEYYKRFFSSFRNGNERENALKDLKNHKNALEKLSAVIATYTSEPIDKEVVLNYK